jgi:hypothetical protein
MLRYGNLLKDGERDPRLTFSHNTVLVVDQRIDSSYNLFRTYHGPPPRRAYNNIFLAINRSAAADLPMWCSADKRRRNNAANIWHEAIALFTSTCPRCI